ncbi:glycosyltransferase family 2 protein [Haladaptatus salinisoli]|uniref:glycosyltransferase family 2 protein n=1 Tax=Haladaptatus salinisoli TaxID=2884876 RepID=UPI001D0BDF64|nr:glycosyltransferase [Haladaptatus salinisoli]
MGGETVSVVVPTYHRNDRLREALDSVADQTHRPAEVIVVDGTEEARARSVVERFDRERAAVDSFARAAYHTPEDEPRYVRDAVASLFGRPGLRVVDALT